MSSSSLSSVKLELVLPTVSPVRFPTGSTVYEIEYGFEPVRVSDVRRLPQSYANSTTLLLASVTWVVRPSVSYWYAKLAMVPEPLVSV